MTQENRLKLAERERAILGAARQTVIDEGLVALRMPGLAKAAGVSVGTLYRHFPSREDVIAALATQSLILRHRKLNLVLARFRKAPERAIAIPMLDFAFNAAHPDAYRLEVACTTFGIWEEVTPFRRQDHGAICAQIEGLLQRVAAEIKGLGKARTTASKADIALGIRSMNAGLPHVWFSIPENRARQWQDALGFAPTAYPQLFQRLRASFGGLGGCRQTDRDAAAAKQGAVVLVARWRR